MKNIIRYVGVALIIIIGTILSIYGLNNALKQYNFLNSAIKTSASIYQISTEKDGSQAVYVNFKVKNKKYDGVLFLKNKNINQSTIIIYYNPKNPTNFTNGEINNIFYFYIISGIILIIIGIRLILKKVKYE